jgi:hypothetical protein
MRDAALRVIREIGVDTGGSNIQFAVNPKDGRMVVIEMNPRVSRSSALASKATGSHRQDRVRSWQWDTHWMKSPMTLPVRHPLVLSRLSITSSSKYRALPLKNSPRPKIY